MSTSIKKHTNLTSSKSELCRSRIGFVQLVGDEKNKQLKQNPRTVSQL
jgi:hypothetical protein